MIILVSIVDKHTGDHVGTYSFEIDYPGNSHFEFYTLACPVELEEGARAQLNRLMTKEDYDSDGGWVRINSNGDFLEESE